MTEPTAAAPPTPPAPEAGTEAIPGSTDVERLYAEHRLGLVRLAVLLVDDQQTADDLVQDVFAGLVERPEAIRDPERAVGYLRTAVVNRSRSALRRRRTARGHVPPRPAGPTPPDEHAVLAEEHREVLAALHGLPTRQREVLVLRYWADLDEASIAAALGIARGTVKSTASRAVDALHRRLGGAP